MTSAEQSVCLRMEWNQHGTPAHNASGSLQKVDCASYEKTLDKTGIGIWQDMWTIRPQNGMCLSMTHEQTIFCNPIITLSDECDELIV